MDHPRSAFGAPPQGGSASGPAKPDPRLPLDGPRFITAMSPLKKRDLIVALSQGSPGRAMALAEAGGADLYRKALALLAELPRVNPQALHALGDAVAGRQAIDDFRLLGELLDGILKRLIAHAATRGGEQGLVPGEAELFTRVSGRAGLDQWIEVWDNLRRLFARADAIDLEPRQTLIGAFGALERAARP